MSMSVAADVIQQIINLIRSGLVGPHNHSATQGGPIVTDLPITTTNALQPAIISRTQVLNQNFNADLWRGARYYVQLIKPTSANKGDLLFDGTTLWEWSGTKWVTATGGISAINFDVNGSLIGSQSTLNLIQGSNTTITGVNNVGASRVDVTVASTGGAPTPHALLDGVQDNDTAAYAPTAGDLIASSGNLWQGLPAGTNGFVLTMTAGLPSWQPATAGTSSLLRDMIALGT